MHPSHHSPSGRLTALGTQLIEIHDWLREELARLRASLDSPGGAGTGLSRELRAHCAGFCAALDRHHTGEDGGAFRLLAEQVPELRPVLAELSADHRLVADVLRRIEALLAGASGGRAGDGTAAGRTADDGSAADGSATGGPAANGAAVRAELDGLAALLESHFTYEERKLVAALDAVTGGTAEELLGLDVPDEETT